MEGWRDGRMEGSALHTVRKHKSKKQIQKEQGTATTDVRNGGGFGEINAIKSSKRRRAVNE